MLLLSHCGGLMEKEYSENSEKSALRFCKTVILTPCG